ncbi:hypothetical protein V5F49_02905 [Xanthobacter sp. V3C-3]|uniref:sensor histidine kinase n=1 Tax=Xanthobacter lutulentifluminis TaxID=3119935 RepID=UPI00372B2FA8
MGLRTQFLVSASLLFAGSMLALGLWIQGRIETDWRTAALAASARFLDDLVGDHVQDLVGPPGPRAEAAAGRLASEIEGNLHREFMVLVVWDQRGREVFSLPRRAMPEALPGDARAAALAGETVTRPLRLAPHGERGMLMRLFAPVRDPSGAAVAVAGVDLWSGEMDRLAREESLKTWPMVGLVCVAMLGMLYLLVTGAAATIERQQAALVRQARHARLLSRRGAVLTRVAEQARHDAMIAIERTLARVGTDIHDGPIQRLAILALTAGDAGRQRELGAELRTVVAELRDITSGLALPELEGLNLEEAVRLAVLGHERLTGTSVTLAFGTLPQTVRRSVKVSSFRVVQEGLSNAYRHGGGIGQAVRVERARGYLVLTISDAGPGMGQAPPVPGKTCLASLTSRVEAMRGTLKVTAVTPSGVRLVVSLPLGLRPIDPRG